MSTETALSRWLRDEMPRRGYPLDGPRAGGLSRLAQDAGISQATMSRLANGQQEPTVAILRKLAALFGIPLGQMMINGGLVEPEEILSYEEGSLVQATITNKIDPGDIDIAIQLPPELDLTSVPATERHLWLTPDASLWERRLLVASLRMWRQEARDSALPSRESNGTD